MRVEELTEAERRVWEAFPRGEEVDFTTGKPEEDHPASGAGWGAERTVRARVIAALLMSEEAHLSHRVPAIRIKGARITERLNVAYSTVRRSVRLLSCFFEQVPGLSWARCPQLSFKGSHLPGLSASNAQIDGHLRLEQCVFTGLVELRGTQLAGNLTLTDVRTSVPGLAIDCDGLHAGRGISAIRLSTAGQVRLANVNARGTVIMDDACLADSGGRALTLDGLVADGSVFCRRMTVSGMVSVRNARVVGSFSFTGTTIDHPGQMAFRGSRITAEGGLYLGGGFTATGTVRLADSRIDRELSLNGARLTHPDGDALYAEELQVEGTVEARRLHTRGRVYLSQARIAGSLDMTGARLHGATPGNASDAGSDRLADFVALDVGRAAIGGELRCAGGFRAQGEVRLVDAHVGKSADFEGARLDNPGGVALAAGGLTVDGGMTCGGAFTTAGELVLIGARIGRRLYLAGATLSAPAGRALAAWQLEARELYLRPKQVPEGQVDLRHARIGVLRDDPATWSRHRLDGLTYDALDPMLPAAERLAWLRNDGGRYVPQPYEQLAATYRRLGDDADARTVLLAKQRRRRAKLPPYARAWGLLQDLTVGYGYRPVRAATWFLTLLVAGTAVFALNSPPRAEPGKGPVFNAVVYTLDLLVPLIDFGQEKAFQPIGGSQWVAYGLVITGWVLVTTIATGITRTLSRQ
ncbi:hypothetical protein [Nonomuraea sediminis]|uniref:hypothetical protein n=1 Tax=Nonomuraea sediminis TaxID=2835864 RepID=UPI001BDC3CCD|nr:hypothetical protein [Nonomuraea sediminis]